MMIPNPTRSMNTVTKRTGSTRARTVACGVHVRRGWQDGDDGKDRGPTRLQGMRLPHAEVVREVRRLWRLRLGRGGGPAGRRPRRLGGAADQRGAALAGPPR